MTTWVDNMRAAMTADDQLDDIKRARIWLKIDDALALRASGRRIGWRWPVALASAAAVAAAIALVARARTTDGDARVLSAPPDVTITASLGPHARAAIVGPAQLAVTSSIGELTTLRLDSGTLYAQFDGGPGRALRVVAPGATVDVVGTLFAIEAGAGASCVSVAHGRVRVTSAGGETLVGARERWCTGDAKTAPIEPRIDDALARHAGVLASRDPATDSAAANASSAPATAESPPASTASSPANTTLSMSDSRTANTPSPATSSPSNTSLSTTDSRAATTKSPSNAGSPRASTTSSKDVTTSSAISSPGSPATPTVPPPSTSPSSHPSIAGSVRPSISSSRTSTADEPADAPEPPVEAPQPPAPQPPTGADLYREAEAALARRDSTAADRSLARLLADDPHSPLADQALYERARIAYQRHAWSEARRHLDALATIPTTPLTEPGRYLACRIAVEAHDADATRCLSEYRAVYPRSAHDLDVLAMLVQLVHADTGCAGARKLVDELVRQYPASPLARGWRARCPETR
jgi:hypothetical protein